AQREVVQCLIVRDEDAKRLAHDRYSFEKVGALPAGNAPTSMQKSPPGGGRRASPYYCKIAIEAAPAIMVFVKAVAQERRGRVPRHGCSCWGECRRRAVAEKRMKGSPLAPRALRGGASQQGS